MENATLQQIISHAYGAPKPLDVPEARAAIDETIEKLDCGELRVASREGHAWVTHAWIKQAILLYFTARKMAVMQNGPFTFYDKIPLKKDIEAQGIRVVPPATVRFGAFLEPGCVVMPGYVNIGAYVGAGSMVDTWATVGSCAQIGRDVHLSGGVGIGGVLEPPQAAPVIIEEGAFIGSRCIVVEGVHVGPRAVLGAGVVLTASTPIIDVTGDHEVVHKGAVPAESVVIPGMRPKVFPAGTYHVPCALIIGKRTPNTDLKISLNDVLRRFELPV